MDSGMIVALISALGIGTVLSKLVEGLVNWVRGRTDREQTAWEQRDDQARKRRQAEESLHGHRRWTHYNCDIPYDEMPSLPDYMLEEK